MDLNRFKQSVTNTFKRVLGGIAGLYRRIRNRLLRYFVPNDDDSETTHVTTGNLEHHRKQVLEQARRYVKPQTATNSHVVRNSIIVGVAAVFVVLIGLYVSVYRLQPTNNFYYQLSQLLPIPVGEVADNNITYDRVLFYFRAESRAEDFQLSTELAAVNDSNKDKLQRSFIKAREAVYFEALADRQGVNVSDEEVRAIISDLPLLESGSTDLDVVLQEFRGWTRNDLFRETRLEALKSARIVPEQLQQLTNSGSVKEFNERAQTLKESGAVTGELSDIDELPEAVESINDELSAGQLSPVIDTDEGAYVLLRQNNTTKYVLVSANARKQLLENQAESAVSSSCLKGLDFNDVEISITANASSISCIF